MGASPTKEIALSKSDVPNGKTVEIHVDLCGSWGFGGMKKQVVSQLIKSLNTQGYDVNYSIEPLNSRDGEYHVYVVKDAVKQIVFSNDRNAHGAQGAIIGRNINSNNVDEVIKKIVA